MQQKEIEFQNKKLYYRVKGSGPVVVLLHGFGEDGTVWKNQYNALPNAQLVIPDLPGSGQSEMIADMSMEGLAETVKAIIVAETRNEGQAILIGHSMGGYITLAFAEKYPELLNGWGLFHSTAYADTQEKIGNRHKGIRFIEQHGAFEFLKTSIPNLYSSVTRQKYPELAEQHLQSVQYFSNAALIAYYRSMIQRPNRTDVLKHTKQPVLFVLGTYDPAVPLKDGLEQTHLSDFSYVHILDSSGHMGMLEEPEKSNSILQEFVLAASKQ